MATRYPSCEQLGIVSPSTAFFEWSLHVTCLFVVGHEDFGVFKVGLTSRTAGAGRYSTGYSEVGPTTRLTEQVG